MEKTIREVKQLCTEDTKIKQKATNLCDQCGKVEDKTHLFTCQGPQMMKAKKDGWEQVKNSYAALPIQQYFTNYIKVFAQYAGIM